MYICVSTTTESEALLYLSAGQGHASKEDGILRDNYTAEFESQV